MRTVPPHPLIRFRHALLGVAVAAWIVGAATLANFKGSKEIPVAPVIALSAFVFIWANGLYWWIIFRYPYIDMGENKYVSRDEWKGTRSGLFLLGYFLFAVVASLACLRVAFNS